MIPMIVNKKYTTISTILSSVNFFFICLVLLLEQSISRYFLYYCIADENSGKQRYINVSNIKEAQNIAQRDYDLKYLKHVESEIKDIEGLLAKKYSDQAKNCYSGINEGRKKLIQPFEMSDEDYIRKWLAMPYQPKGFTENDTTEYYTDKGERVRSKSEIIIANMLKTLNIPYKY